MTCLEIKHIIDEFLGLDISGPELKLKNFHGRTTFVYFCFRYAKEKVTYTYLGKLLNRHHATIIHSLKSFYNDYETDKDFKKLVSQLDDIIKPKSEIDYPDEFKKIDNMSLITLKRRLKNKVLKRRKT